MFDFGLLVMNDFLNFFFQSVADSFILDGDIFFYHDFSIFVMFSFCW